MTEAGSKSHGDVPQSKVSMPIGVTSETAAKAYALVQLELKTDESFIAGLERILSELANYRVAASGKGQSEQKQGKGQKARVGSPR